LELKKDLQKLQAIPTFMAYVLGNPTAIRSYFHTHMRMYPKVSGLVAWSKNCNGTALCH
jgi:hypothetical protein